ARQRLNDARWRTDEVARELERHLRETGPQPNQPFDAPRADAELARRLEPLAQRKNEAAAVLAALDVEPRAEPQREPAGRRLHAGAAGPRPGGDRPGPDLLQG